MFVQNLILTKVKTAYAFERSTANKRNTYAAVSLYKRNTVRVHTRTTKRIAQARELFDFKHFKSLLSEMHLIDFYNTCHHVNVKCSEYYRLNLLVLVCSVQGILAVRVVQPNLHQNKLAYSFYFHVLFYKYLQQ